MKIEDSFTLPATIERAWDTLIDPIILAKCVPGIDALEAIDERTFRGTLKVKVGPIKTNFVGTAKFVEMNTPHYLQASIKGDDKKTASVVQATFSATFEPAANGTKINYSIEVTMRGRLAQFGSAMMQGIAKKLAAKFVDCIQATILAEENR